MLYITALLNVYSHVTTKYIQTLLLVYKLRKSLFGLKQSPIARFWDWLYTKIKIKNCKILGLLKSLKFVHTIFTQLCRTAVLFEGFYPCFWKSVMLIVSHPRIVPCSSWPSAISQHIMKKPCYSSPTIMHVLTDY